MFCRFLRLGLQQQRPRQAQLALVGGSHAQQACHVVLLQCQVGVQQCLVALAPCGEAGPGLPGRAASGGKAPPDYCTNCCKSVAKASAAWQWGQRLLLQIVQQTAHASKLCPTGLSASAARKATQGGLTSPEDEVLPSKPLGDLHRLLHLHTGAVRNMLHAVGSTGIFAHPRDEGRTPPGLETNGTQLLQTCPSVCYRAAATRLRGCMCKHSGIRACRGGRHSH